ncbi:MAG: glycosyltransferase family 2 protein [Gemmatimonadota bacterium]|nr:glycosyltransferase family 2 protein [Gemmatimonadota bacterium]
MPTWNGRQLLERFLPSVLRALGAYPPGGEVLVVDDGSTDGTPGMMKKKFPGVKTIRLETNRGFSAAVNRGVAEAAREVVILLNNDVRVSEGFIAPLASHLEDPVVFGAGAKSLDWDGETFRDGGKVGSWRRGFWRVWQNYDLAGGGIEPAQPLPTFYCPGGFSAFSRRKWLKLGGLDELFSPFNWEDTDLCYRALKRGFKLVYEPRSIVFHRPNTTIEGAFRRRYVRYISRRNRLLFHWKNLTGGSMLAEHVFYLALSLPVSLLRLDFVSVAAVAGALGKLPQVRERRAVEKARCTLTDAGIRDFYRDVPPVGDLGLVLK